MASEPRAIDVHDWSTVQDATEAVRSRWRGAPEVGIILGTGLGALAKEIEAEATIPYPEIPHFPRSTVQGHRGQLVCGRLAGKTVMAMEGRFHVYEGYTAAQVTLPIRVMKELGCRYLIVSNAAGGLNPQHRKGEIVVIEDHINLMGVNPLVGPNDDRLGPRFPDMIEPYHRPLQDLALQVALEENVVAHRGVFVAVVGPNLETRAEYRFLRADGGDTVRTGGARGARGSPRRPEGLGFSIITDMCLPDALAAVSLDEIIAVAQQAEGKLRTIVKGVLTRLHA
ncbi:MAG: purine-nucleoside phosphorylase [Isosphaeraceae bacterium]